MTEMIAGERSATGEEECRGLAEERLDEVVLQRAELR